MKKGKHHCHFFCVSGLHQTHKHKQAHDNSLAFMALTEWSGFLTVSLLLFIVAAVFHFVAYIL